MKTEFRFVISMRNRVRMCLCCDFLGKWKEFWWPYKPKKMTGGGPPASVFGVFCIPFPLRAWQSLSGSCSHVLGNFGLLQSLKCRCGILQVTRDLFLSFRNLKYIEPIDIMLVGYSCHVIFSFFHTT